MSRATISVPFRFRRVLIGYLESVSSTLSIPSSRSISTAGFIIGASAGRKRGRIVFELFEENTLFGYLCLDIAVGRAVHADTHRTRRRMAGHPDNPHVMNKVFAPELRPDAALLAYLQYFRLPLQIAESTAPLVAACRQRIVITGRSFLTAARLASAEVPPITTARW